MKRCVESIYGKAKSPHLVEVLVLLDSDDAASNHMISTLCSIHSNCSIVTRQRGAPLIHYYNNWGALRTMGKFAMVMNDDCEMITENWEAILEKKAEKVLAKDRLAYILINDTHHCNPNNECNRDVSDEVGTTFPIVTRELVRLFNGIFPNEITTFGADSTLYFIFKKWDVSRIINLKKDIRLVHHYQETSNDETNVELKGFRGGRSALTSTRQRHYINLLEQEKRVHSQDRASDIKRGFFKRLLKI